MKLAGGALLWMIIAVLFFKWHAAEEENERQARHWRDLERELDQGLAGGAGVSPENDNPTRWTG